MQHKTEDFKVGHIITNNPDGTESVPGYTKFKDISQK